MDRAFDYGSKGWGFKSLRDRTFLLPNQTHKFLCKKEIIIIKLIFRKKFILLLI